MRERIKWIDIVRCFGIFAIYLGHFCAPAGKAYGFVITHHVDLFFLVSGCMEIFNEETNFFRYLKKKIKNILVPFWLFSFASIASNVIAHDVDLASIKQMLILVLKGAIRNDFYALSLWFFTCVFVIQIMFFFIKKLKNKFLILTVCFGLFIVAETCISPRPIVDPNWIYNIDSAVYFIIYYAIGFVAFPYIRTLFELNSIKKKIIFVVSGCIAFGYAAYLFQGIDLVKRIPVGGVPAMMLNISRTVLVIWLYFVVAKLCENIKVLADVGRETLYLCGNEYIIKIMLPSLVSLLGFEIALGNPLVTYMYTIICLLVTYKLLIPAEKAVIRSAKKVLTARQ